MGPYTVAEGSRCSGWITSSVSRAFSDDINNAAIVYASWSNDVSSKSLKYCEVSPKKRKSILRHFSRDSRAQTC